MKTLNEYLEYKWYCTVCKTKLKVNTIVNDTMSLVSKSAPLFEHHGCSFTLPCCNKEMACAPGVTEIGHKCS